MNYNLKKINCPSCGGTIDMDITGRGTVFCPYCGTQIAVDDGSQNININHHITNDAEIEREHRKERENEKNRKTLKWIMIGCVIIIVATLIFLMFQY